MSHCYKHLGQTLGSPCLDGRQAATEDVQTIPLFSQDRRRELCSQSESLTPGGAINYQAFKCSECLKVESIQMGSQGLVKRSCFKAIQ